jgi:Phage integrase family
MPRVDFSRLSSKQYEDMISVLLSRIRQTRRVDGSGGDGGRDCYFSDENGTDVYELKSFLGRMNDVRRQQVTRSLQRALKGSPRIWSLVVPIDATPKEQEWFDSLASATTTTLTWLDKTWLEQQLAAHPDIGRYFAGASDEVIQILKDIAREDALPSDAAGVAMRMSATVARLNEIDPYYTFDFTIAEDRTVVSCRPRYPDALRDRPISFSAQLKLDDATPPGLRAAIDDFMLYGSAVQIPAENIGGLSIDMPGGLGSQFAGGGMALDGKIAVADAAEAKYLVLRVPPVPRRRNVASVMGWAVEAVADYAENIRPRFGAADHPALWVTERGGRIKPAEINARFVAYRDAIGLPRQLSPHSLRHSYVTHLTEDGADRRFIQEQVGHRCDTSTAIYTHVSSDFMNTALRKAIGPAFDGPASQER